MKDRQPVGQATELVDTPGFSSEYLRVWLIQWFDLSTWKRQLHSCALRPCADTSKTRPFPVSNNTLCRPVRAMPVFSLLAGAEPFSYRLH